jgi:hypothetical protein
MRTERHGKGQEKGEYGWQSLRQAFGAIATLIAFVAVVLTVIVLPGLLTDSASTVAPRVAREAHR